MNPQPSRYTDRPLPAYRYTPGGAHPHPVRDPAGHSYNRELPAERLDPSAWRSCDTYLFAIDLFNAGYWWESHEALEALWQGSGPDTQVGTFLRGLIQLAAACLKRHADETGPAARLLERGARHAMAGGETFMGIDVARLTADTDAYVRGSHDEAGPPRIALALEP